MTKAAKLANDIMKAIQVNWKYMTIDELTSILKILKAAQKRVQNEVKSGRMEVEE